MRSRKVMGAGGAVVIAALVAILAIAPWQGGDHLVRPNHARISVEGAYFLTGAGTTPATPFDLDKTAQMIAVVTPSAHPRSETVAGHQVTLTMATVTETVKGALPHTITLRQGGTAGVVSPGHAYLAYVKPFVPPAGHLVPGQYVVVGGAQGLLEEDTTEPSRGSAQMFESPTDGPGAEAFSVTLTLAGK